MKPYRVDFKYLEENTASMYVIAPSPEAAGEGCKQILDEEGMYYDAEVTSVTVHKKQQSPTTLQ